jgi:hypothetical protein
MTSMMMTLLCLDDSILRMDRAGNVQLLVSLVTCFVTDWTLWCDSVPWGGGSKTHLTKDSINNVSKNYINIPKVT